MGLNIYRRHEKQTLISGQKIERSAVAQLVMGSKVALVCLYLRVPQAAGQVKILIVLVKVILFPIDVNIFCDAGQVLISRYFEACGRVLDLGLKG